MVKILPILILLFTFYFLVPDTQATGECLISTTDPNIEGGLISAPSISGFSTGSGVCNQDPSSAFAPYAFENKFNYASLKSLYFDQSKLTSKVEHIGTTGENQLRTDLNTDGKNLIYINGDLGINNTIAGSTTAVVFVKDNLFFASPMTQFTYGDANSGIVFIVQGNVYIDPTVKSIDAIIISAGKIYTAATYPSTCNHKFPVSTTTPLVINGSLISIYKDRDQAQKCTSDTPPSSCPIIEFCRTLLGGNTGPSELINHQVKYLVLLRSILSDTLQRWSEIQ